MYFTSNVFLFLGEIINFLKMIQRVGLEYGEESCILYTYVIQYTKYEFSEDDVIFEKWLMPDLVLDSYELLTPETVLGMGASAILSDIDNTVATYDDPTPPESVIRWVEKMRRAGVEVAFVSNNNEKRVRLFCSELNCFCYAKAGKPSVAGLDAAVRALGIDRSKAMLLGDQLLTDCAAGKRFGIPTVIVPPIKDKKTLFFKFKRMLEIPYMKKYRRLHAQCTAE